MPEEIINPNQVERELMARLRQQSTLTELSQLALTTSDPFELMDEIVRQVAQILDVEFSKIQEFLPENNELLLIAGVGWKERLLRQARVSAAPVTQAGYTITNQEPVVVTDLRTDTRFSSSELLIEHGVISGITVIIPGKEKPYGVLGVHARRPREFSSDDTKFVQSIANILASAIERARVEKSLRSSRDQLAVILSSVAEGITAQDPSGRLIYANQAAARVIGFETVEELLNTPLVDVMQRFEVLDEGGQPFPLEKLPGRMALRGITGSTANVRFRVQETGEEHWSVVKAQPVISHSGEVELAVNIFQDITDLKRREQAQQLLVEAGNLLAASLDYLTTLGSVARMSVPDFADWCAVHLIEEDESVRQIAVAHADSNKLELVQKIQLRYPPDWNSNQGVARVLMTGQSEHYPEIPDDLLQATARDAEHLRLIRELGLRSAIIVPLVARGRTLGAISLVWAESGRKYTPTDVALAEELARRAAMAIDNARLYKEAQALNTDLEARVEKRTVQLQNMLTKLRSEIAERKKAEAALRQNETMLESLFESAPDAVVLVDSVGTIVRVNLQAETMFGYSRQELLGQPVETLLPERFQGGHLGFRSNFLNEPRTRPMGADTELYGLRKTGQEFPVDIMLSPVEIGDELLTISAIRDSTQRKESERIIRERETELAEVQRQLLDAVEAERLHLSQELHDGPIQELYGLSYQLNEIKEVLEQAYFDDPEMVEAGLEVLRTTSVSMNEVIHHLRTVCGELRPPALAPFGLEKAIEAHVEEIRGKYPDLDLRTTLMPDGQVLPERVRLGLFRIYQHSVSNVIRHAQATQLEIRFSFDDQMIRLEIQDDGCGFQLPPRWIDLARSGHLGLVGTLERAQAIGGVLNIQTSPGQGTLVQVTVPNN